MLQSSSQTDTCKKRPNNGFVFLSRFNLPPLPYELVSPVVYSCWGHWLLKMERVTGGGFLQLLLASAGAVLLYRLLLRLRPGATLQDAVVVITGASSGLGKGGGLWFSFTSSSSVCLCARWSLNVKQWHEGRLLCGRVCTSLPRCRRAARAMRTRCNPPAAGRPRTDGKRNTEGVHNETNS